MKKGIYSLLILTSFTTPLFAEEVAPPLDNSLWQTFVMIAIAIAFFYVILLRPEQKRRKAADDQRNALKKGDRVIAMGIIGTVVRLEEQTAILKMYDGSKIEVYKAAITEVLPPETDKKKVTTLDDDKE